MFDGELTKSSLTNRVGAIYSQEKEGKLIPYELDHHAEPAFLLRTCQKLK